MTPWDWAAATDQRESTNIPTTQPTTNIWPTVHGLLYFLWLCIVGGWVHIIVHTLGQVHAAWVYVQEAEDSWLKVQELCTTIKLGECSTLVPA